MGIRELKAKIEALKDESKPHHTGEILELINSADFREFQKKIFSSAPAEPRETPPVDYVKEVAEYTFTAIRLYEDAVPHKKIISIDLYFDEDTTCGKIQPQIDIRFDTGLYHIDIGMFWDDEIGLERENKKNCQTMAEMIWFEFREDKKGFREVLFPLAMSIRQAVAERYPQVEVNYKLTAL